MTQDEHYEALLAEAIDQLRKDKRKGGKRGS